MRAPPIKEGKLVTNGGRVLGVTATAATLPEALKKAYAASESIHFDKLHIAQRHRRKSAGCDAVTEEYTMVYRIYVEKKPGFDGEAQGLLPRAASTCWALRP